MSEPQGAVWGHKDFPEDNIIREICSLACLKPGPVSSDTGTILRRNIACFESAVVAAII